MRSLSARGKIPMLMTKRLNPTVQLETLERTQIKQFSNGTRRNLSQQIYVNNISSIVRSSIKKETIRLFPTVLKSAASCVGALHCDLKVESERTGKPLKSLGGECFPLFSGCDVNVSVPIPFLYPPAPSSEQSP